MAKVSVIMPTRNRLEFLKEAIASVLSQTFRDWELIVIDDGSTDNTRAIVEAYARNDFRIRYVYRPKGGLSGLRALGVLLAQGTFVTFLDDDDAFYPEKLERQVEFLEKRSDVGLVYSYLDMVDEHKNFQRIWPTRPALSFIELVRECTIQPNAALVRREVFAKIGSFRTDLKSCDDYDLWLRISRVFPIAFLPEWVGLYRWHASNLSHDWKRRCASHVQIFKDLLKQKLSKEERSEVVRRALEVTYWRADDALTSGEYPKAAYYFFMAIRLSPFVGNWVGWSRFSNQAYRLLKPYFAFAFCGLMGMLSYLKGAKSVYAKG